MGAGTLAQFTKCPTGKYTQAQNIHHAACACFHLVSSVQLLKERLTVMPKAACDWSKQPLGLVPDRELAEHLGVSVVTVRRQRHKAGKLQLDMSVRTKIIDLLSTGDALSPTDIAEALDKATTWIQKKLHQLVRDGDVWRHKASRGYRYTLAGVKMKRISAFNGSKPAEMKATPNEGSALGGDACDDLVIEPGCVNFIEYDTEDRSDAFYCKRKREAVTLRHCVELFGEVHAMQASHAVCWACQQGAQNRLTHCFDLTPTSSFVSDVLHIATETPQRHKAEVRLRTAMNRGGRLQN